MISVSTHVLDTERGRPARGVPVTLRSGDEVVASGTTDDDGRARLAEGLDPGTYRLAFEPPSPFFRRVELEVELAEGHYHVPLLLAPYSCTTYRGS